MIDQYIDHPFMDHYTWDGRLLDEPDHSEPQLRRHCVKCGAFLPREPREVVRIVPVVCEYTYNDEGDITSVLVLAEEKEIDVVWTCRKCGKEHDSDEMYI